MLLVLGVRGGELVNLLLKLLFARPRPLWPHPLLTLTSYSFPSAHAMRSVIFYRLLGYLAIPQIGTWQGRVRIVVAGGALAAVYHMGYGVGLGEKIVRQPQRSGGQRWCRRIWTAAMAVCLLLRLYNIFPLSLRERAG